MTSSRPGPSPPVRRLLATPTFLYDLHVGWLLGRRFLRLTHLGRRTGRRYRTMLEVIGEHRGNGEVLVMAGLGRSAQWLRNVQAGNAMEVAIGHDRFRPRHRMLTPAEASEALADYERRYRVLAPIVRRVLSWLVGWCYDGSVDARLRLVTQLPVVGFRPDDHGDHGAPTPPAYRAG
jgi:deazaflavin-dependent oxidoreductase (nitroreductase family)